MCRRVSISALLLPWLSGLLLLAGVNSVLAEQDTLQAVMARMQPQQAVAIRYQERRSMALLAETWTCTGYFYAALPDVMLKEQQTPEQELMGVQGTRWYYYKSGEQQRHQGALDEETALEMHLGAFKGLINGNLAYLLTLYTIDFSTKAHRWQLTLTDKNLSASDAGVKVMMQGAAGQVADKLILLLADGDRTEYLLTPAESGAKAEAKIQKLLLLLTDKT